MDALKMKAIQYRGELWKNGAVHPELWHLLEEKDLLVELSYGSAPYRVTLGVPHHAKPGINRIAEDWINPKTGSSGRAADETTGLIGLAIFSALVEKEVPSNLVIAAHATDHDPNKTPGSPYWTRIFAQPLPGLLFEAHGAAKHRHHALELSAGRNKVAYPLDFGRVLAYFLKGDQTLAVQESPGTSRAFLFNPGSPPVETKLQNPALETDSLIYAGEQGIPALHLEMKSAFRQPDPRFTDGPHPSEQGWELAQALASSIELITQPDDIHISGEALGLPTTAFLTRPSVEYAESFLSATREATLSEMGDNPDLRIGLGGSLYAQVEDLHQVIFEGLPEHPPEEYLWLIDQGEFIGRVLLLQWLNEYRLKSDGQVDYWIRPSKRRQGYGKLILRLLLERCRQLGLERILISCRSDNLASKKIILANGGVFDSEIELSDIHGLHPRLRYWIEIR